MAAVTICSDFGAPKNKVWHCFHYFPVYFPWSDGTRCHFSSIQFSSVDQSCPTLFDPMNRSTPGLPIHHQLPKFTQTHVHRVSDAIQLSHPLSYPSPLVPVSSSVWPHRWQPNRLLCPWDSPGKNTGVGCHFLLQCMHACYVTLVVSGSVRPHEQQPTRFFCPRDSPGKNTAVGCHFLLQLRRAGIGLMYIGKFSFLKSLTQVKRIFIMTMKQK